MSPPGPHHPRRPARRRGTEPSARGDRARDDRGDGRAALGCFGALAVLALLTVGAGALPIILSALFWKFVFPALLFAGVVIGFLALVLGDDQDDGTGG